MPHTPVLHSVSYSAAWPGQARLDVDAFLVKAAELGYRSVALVAKRPHVSPLDYDNAARRRLKARIRELGLELAALMGYTDFTASIERPGIPSAEMNAAYVESLCGLAADLETPRLRIFTAYEREGVGYDRQYGELVEGLRLAAAAAARHGVTLLLQNHHDIAVHHDQLIWLVREVAAPNLRLAFDAWSPFLQGLRGDDLADAAAAAVPWMGWTTVADYVFQPRYHYEPQYVNYVRREPDLLRAVAPGDGVVDYSAFFRGLRRAGYQGHVAYEMCAPLSGGGSIENLDRAARRFLEFLKAFD
jgi:sugar phosphate isomerase/epimerase